MADGNKPRLIGINHVAIEVGDIDEALAWYGQIFDFTLRGKGERNAFIDMGDQFINLTRVPDYRQDKEERRHIGFVVDDRSRIIELAKAAGDEYVATSRELIAISIIGIIAGMGLGFVIGQYGIAQPMRVLVGLLQRMAKGETWWG